MCWTTLNISLHRTVCFKSKRFTLLSSMANTVATTGCRLCAALRLTIQLSSFLILADHLKDWCNIQIGADSLLSLYKITKKSPFKCPSWKSALFKAVLCCIATIYIFSLNSWSKKHKQAFDQTHVVEYGLPCLPPAPPLSRVLDRYT